ncbi:hypothetical protein EYC84_003814 [Monilinia fructicola]|uniref:Uncharacterized protein n=1 Tax=Monilinia fructicola TaxID=38448 RepID=A0A5M9JXG0_MONFR|nr:hypothetical protein EYC84_003814 [Monilinia fructicola]
MPRARKENRLDRFTVPVGLEALPRPSTNTAPRLVFREGDLIITKWLSPFFSTVRESPQCKFYGRLTHDRKDLGHNGWERLVGEGNVKCMSTPGNHFTMMRDPITVIVELIKEALEI